MYLTSCILIPLISPSLPTCPPPLFLPPINLREKRKLFKKEKNLKSHRGSCNVTRCSYLMLTLVLCAPVHT